MEAVFSKFKVPELKEILTYLTYFNPRVNQLRHLQNPNSPAGEMWSKLRNLLCKKQRPTVPFLQKMWARSAQDITPGNVKH